MQNEELKTLFDQQAPGYDKQWARMAPIREGMYFFLDAVFAGLPANARILSVGVGTGLELANLARRFPAWTFTAVDPSGAMLAVCRERARAEGFISRCRFHEGYLDSLSPDDLHDGATCFLVSQFILSREARIAFFRDIATRLVPGGVLASSDLAADVTSTAYDTLLRVWLDVMSTSGVRADALERMRRAYARDVAVLPPEVIASMIQAGGFEAPVRFYQAGLIHAWFSRRADHVG